MTMGNVIRAAAAASALAMLAGCPVEQGVVCREGQVACGETCVDVQADPQNCGACGVVCQAGQSCQGGACACPSDRAECFDSHGVCTSTDSDPAHCGACGNACDAGEVCEAGQCQLDCSEGKTECDGACVDTQTSAQHCGACGNVCAQAQSCHDGACGYDVIAACFTNGQVRGVQAGTFELAPLQDLGAGPQALARFGAGHLLAVDGTDNLLTQAAYPSLTQLTATAAVGALPNHLLVDGELVYVINSLDATLQILRQQGEPDMDGVDFTSVGEHNFGANTWPQVMAKVGDTVYVTLLGDSGAGAAAGQRVVAVDVADPAAPVAGMVWDLNGLTEPFMPGGESLPRPAGITHHQGTLYVALNNSDSSYATAGPAAVAVIPLAGGDVTAIQLPADTCRNAGWVQATGNSVLVSCLGQADYSMWPTVLVGQTALALIQEGEVKSVLEVKCPAGATAEECPAPSLGRFDVVGDRVYVADQSAGRLYVAALDAEAGTLTAVRTHDAGGGPLNVCPVDPMTGFSNVGDVLGAR